MNGLRALAVILVLFYHLDFEWMKGGFLGVDIFLVISGYFISKNILIGLQNSSFTFTGFYTKRLRRLFPALIFTLIVVLIAGYFFLIPMDYERLGLSAIFSSLSASNFFFWSESGYFNANASTKPLLHMWSLSLEEQFYLFWPLVLVIFYRFLKSYLVIAISVLILISIFLAEVFFSTQPEATFFLIPFRMFEFLLGALCIWIELKFLKKTRYLLEAFFLLGLFLMLYSAIAFSDFTRMPGFLSLVPCLGAMLVIIGGKATFSSWFLKNKPMELIGKASYSIYLIHWPIIVYYKFSTLESMSPDIQVLLGLSSVVAGFAMWHFIENTFRYRKIRKPKIDPIWITIPILILMVSSVAAMIWKTEGIPSRYADELYMPKEEILANREMYFEEYREKGKLLEGIPGEGHVMVMGSSHSIDLIFALRQNGMQAKITALRTLGKCYNFGESFEPNVENECAKVKEQNLQNENWEVVDAVYLHDHWPNWDPEGFNTIIKRIRNITPAPIFVFGPKMTYVNQVPEIIRKAETPNVVELNKIGMKFARIGFKDRLNNNLKEEFSREYYPKNNVHYVDMFEVQGGVKRDSFEIISRRNMKFLYFDNSHFTQTGSMEFGLKLKKRYPHLFDINKLKVEYSSN